MSYLEGDSLLKEIERSLENQTYDHEDISPLHLKSEEEVPRLTQFQAAFDIEDGISS
jgi:hypothetical protein